MYDYFMEKLIYKKFILGTGAYLDKALAKGLGGVIFFTRDIHSKEQFQALINDIKQKAVYKLFLSIDQEGGRVERTENIHARYLSPRFAYERGEDFLRNQAKKIAQELKDYGINLNFAPCADVNTNPKNPIIGERAFSSITYDVVNAVKIVSETYRQNGIIPCLKHFPGHGDASMDSHLTLPIIDLPMSTMENIHIKPFKENLDAEMIMAAHLHCTCFDNEPIPASLSKNVIGYLRNVLKYDGVVITDDMVMKGVQNFGSAEACKMAIKAGVDMFIFRDADENAVNTIEQLIVDAKEDEVLMAKILESDLRIESLKIELTQSRFFINLLLLNCTCRFFSIKTFFAENISSLCRVKRYLRLFSTFSANRIIHFLLTSVLLFLCLSAISASFWLIC